MRKGHIIIISGPSGSGKTTLSKQLLASQRLKGKLVRSISTTTRPKRGGEKHGRDYLFISKKMFLYKKRMGHFLESEKVFCDYYGTPHKRVRKLLREGKYVLLCIDVKGARTVWRKHPDTVKIFIKTRSFSVLRKRLANRATEGNKDLTLRLKTAKKELNEAKYYDFIIINDALKKAYRKLEGIVYSLVCSKK